MSGPRDTGSLYTGGGSQTAARRQAERAAQRLEQKQEDRTKLIPAADLVFAEIKKQRAQIAREVLKYVKAETPPAELHSTLLALRMYDESLASLGLRMMNILRVPERPNKRVKREPNLSEAEL